MRKGESPWRLAWSRSAASKGRRCQRHKALQRILADVRPLRARTAATQRKPQRDLQNAPVRRQRACLRRVNAVRLLLSWMSAAMAVCAAASACQPLRAPRLPACRAAAASAQLAEPRSALRLKTCLWRPSGAQLLHSVRSKQRSSARRCRLRAAASLLSPNDAWTVWAVLLSTSALGIWRVCRAASSCVVGLPLTTC